MAFDPSVKEQILSVIPIIINTTVVNCGSTWVANAMFFLVQPEHTPHIAFNQSGWLEISYHCGRIISCFPAATLSDKFGRKPTNILLGCTHLCAWLILSLAYSAIPIYAARFLQGIGTSLQMASIFATIGEIFSPELRPFGTALFQFLGSLGSLSQSLISSLFSSYFLVLYTTTALTFTFFPSMYWLIETPYFLVSKGKHEKGKRILKSIRSGNSESKIAKEFEEIQECIEKDNREKTNSSWWQYISSKSNRKSLICIIMLNSLILFSGQNAILVFSTIILPKNQYFPNNYYPFILNLMQLISLMFSVLVTNIFSRRRTFMLAGVFVFLIQAFNALSYCLYENAKLDSAELEVWKLIFLCGNATFYVVYFGLMLPLIITVRSEIFSHGFKNIANAVVAFTHAVSNIILIQSFIVMKNQFGLPFCYTIFALNSLLLVLIVYVSLPETRNKSLAEIQLSQSLKGSNRYKAEKCVRNSKEMIEVCCHVEQEDLISSQKSSSN